MDNDKKDAEKEKNIGGPKEIAEYLFNSPSDVIFFSDDHISSRPQDIAAEILTQLSKTEGFNPDDYIVFMEALYDGSTPEEGKLFGRVLQSDNSDGEFSQPTNYRGFIQKVLDAGFTIRGIDMQKWVDQSGSERMNYWAREINHPDWKGKKKIIQTGAGHLWNDERNPADIMTRIPFTEAVIVNLERSYYPKKDVAERKVISMGEGLPYHVVSYRKS